MFILAFGVIIGLSIGLSVWLVKSERGPQKPVLSLVAAFCFGLLAIGIALTVEQKAIPSDIIALIFQGKLPLGALLLVSLLIGFIEEAAKFVPLAAFLHRKDYFTKHIDGIIYFAFCGLAFGLVENGYYIHKFGGIIGLYRAAMLMFFHPAASAIVGYFFARFSLDHKAWWEVLFALVAVAALHGLYDFGVGSNSWLLLMISLSATLLLNVGLFFFHRRAKRIDMIDEVLASEKTL